MIFTRWTLDSEHFRIQDNNPARSVIRDTVSHRELQLGDVFSKGDHSRETVEKVLRNQGIKFVDCDPDKYRQSLGGHNPPPLYIVTEKSPSHTQWGMVDEYKIDYGDEVLVNAECTCFDKPCTCGDNDTPELVPAKCILLIDGTSGDATTEWEVAEAMARCFELFKIKHKSYGPGNIAELGIKGVFVRLNDKLKRLKRLVWDGIPNPLMDETEQDTWMDIVNYGLIAILIREDKWPND